jgi:hypothetical protein
MRQRTLGLKFVGLVPIERSVGGAGPLGRARSTFATRVRVLVHYSFENDFLNPAMNLYMMACCRKRGMNSSEGYANVG